MSALLTSEKISVRYLMTHCSNYTKSMSYSRVVDWGEWHTGILRPLRIGRISNEHQLD